MEKREEIIKVLDAIIPNEVSNLYIELIKLIDLYNLKYYYLNIKNKELSKLISTIIIDELKENKRLLINTEIENVSYLQILLLFVIPLILVLICGVSYVLGTKKFTFGEKIIYKNK